MTLISPYQRGKNRIPLILVNQHRTSALYCTVLTKLIVKGQSTSGTLARLVHFE